MYTPELIFKIYYLTLSLSIMTLVLQTPSTHIGEVGDFGGNDNIKVYLILLCG